MKKALILPLIENTEICSRIRGHNRLINWFQKYFLCVNNLGKTGIYVYV